MLLPNKASFLVAVSQLSYVAACMDLHNYIVMYVDAASCQIFIATGNIHHGNIAQACPAAAKTPFSPAKPT